MTAIAEIFCADERLARIERDGQTLWVKARLSDRPSLLARVGVVGDLPDPELVMAAYRKWGDACVDYLAGDFAFCVATGERIFCARDHLGVMPFCYALVNGQFHFALSARPVAGAIQASLNESRIADYLVSTMEHGDLTSTFYREVTRLPPAHTLVVDAGGSRVKPYWQARVQQAVAGEDFVPRFTDLLQLAIQERAPGGSLAIALSGGIDSSIVAAIASGTSEVSTYSAIADDVDDSEESQLILQLLSTLRVSGKTVTPSQLDDFGDALFRQVSGVSEPFDGLMLQRMLTSMLASRDGHSLIADGVEGDLVYSLPDNYPSYLFRCGEVFTGLSELLRLREIYHGKTVSRREVVFTQLRCLVPGLANRLRPSMPPDAGSLIAPALAADTDVVRRMQAAVRPVAPDLAQVAVSRVMHPAIPVALERLDRVCGQSGLDVIHPLLDKRLVEFSLSLPSDQRVRNGYTKYLLRRAGEGHVPGTVRWQKGKVENAWRFNAWFLDRYRQRMMDNVMDNQRLLADYVNPKALQAPDDADLWRLHVLACWLGHRG